MTDLETSISYVLTISALDDSQYQMISERLEQTKGLTLDLSPYYRVYYVLGLVFWLDPNNNLISAEGAKFDQNTEVVRRYMNWQTSVDINNKLTVPNEYSSQYFIDTVLTKDPTPEVRPSLPIGFLSFN
jgi:hypothetical protein